MNYWEFTSDNNWFSLKLPENWAEYDDEENVFAFFNTEKWSGNLRITHFRWEDEDAGDDKALSHIQSALNDNPDAVSVKLNAWDATFYSKETTDGGIIYYWIIGSKNDLFICSFSFDKPFLNTTWHNDELIVVKEIIGSLKIIG